MRISIDECKERTARLRAKKDSFIKACSSSFHENNDEDLKVIDASPIRPMFCNKNLMIMGLMMNQLCREGVPKIWIKSVYIYPEHPSTSYMGAEADDWPSLKIL